MSRVNKSSTEYLDSLLLEGEGLVVRDVMDAFKGYCGLFSFVLSISQMDNLSNSKKITLIKEILDSSMLFMVRKYKANLEVYNRIIEDRPEPGKRFNDSVVVPLKLQEDYELGIEEAKQLLYIEIEDILKILNIDLES
jgi:hypothetical protein